MSAVIVDVPSYIPIVYSVANGLFTLVTVALVILHIYKDRTLRGEICAHVPGSLPLTPSWSRLYTGLIGGLLFAYQTLISTLLHLSHRVHGLLLLGGIVLGTLVHLAAFVVFTVATAHGGYARGDVAWATSAFCVSIVVDLLLLVLIPWDARKPRSVAMGTVEGPLTEEALDAEEEEEEEGEGIEVATQNGAGWEKGCGCGLMTLAAGAILFL